MPYIGDFFMDKSKYHFTQVYEIKQDENDLDFFDVNLKYDTPLFIDPFLLKNSTVGSDRELFTRFGLFFKDALKKISNINLEDQVEKEFFLDHLTFKEPKQLYLGFTADSNEGSGPGPGFAKVLFNFFVNQTLKKIIDKEELYPENKFNPSVFEIVAKNVGPDSISDLSACLIMDYLIEYTQAVCKEFDIPTKPLATPRYFNFEEMEWVEGAYRELPENPHTGMAVILTPKRILRGYDIKHDKNITHNLQHLLELDPILKLRFADFIKKNVSEVSADEVHSILINNDGLIKHILDRMEGKNPGQYDFVSDPDNLLSLKFFADFFRERKPSEPTECKDVLNNLFDFLKHFQKYIRHNGGWKDFWIRKGAKLSECREEKIGRQFHAMGFSWFSRDKDYTFCNEVSHGNGFVDFYLIYKNCRIVIELKKLSNNSNTGSENLPAYIHGYKKQLPEYVKQHDAKYAVYLTGQHHKSLIKGRKNHDNRVNEIENLTEEIEKELQNEIDNFESLHYVNIDLSPQASPSTI